MKGITVSALAVLGLLAFCQPAAAQCNVNKKLCTLDDDGYKSNGQFSFVSLSAGEIAELSLVFYRGLDYNIVLCRERKLVDLEFKIVSSNEEVLFDNRDHDLIQNWTFTMSGTQRLRLEVKVPGYAFEGDKTKKGCVNVLIGHRKTEP